MSSTRQLSPSTRNGRVSDWRVLLLWMALCLLLHPVRKADAANIGHELTGLDVVRAKYGLRGNGQTVAIIDTGIAFDHPALGGGFGPGFRVAGGRDFTGENDSNPYDDAPAGSHGTHVAGIVGAADGLPDTGVAPAADLVALRVFNDAGGGSFDWIENALQWVHENRNAFQYPITTVNLSFGASWNSDVAPPWATLEEELSQLEADGIFISAAAGNEFATYAEPGLAYPAASTHIVPVMSFDDSGQLSYFSQRHTRAIAAPGRNISSTVPDYADVNDGVLDGYEERSGTNIAAPYLAGASVLIREAMELVGYVDVTQQTIYDHMLATADSIYDSSTDRIYSRLNLSRAIEELLPDDDYGSTAETAYDLGPVAAQTEFAGLIGGTDDADFFKFVAIGTGTAFLTTASLNYLDPNWVVSDEQNQVIIENSGSLVVFPVTAGREYTLGLTSRSGIGYFDGALSVDSTLLGDFNLDGSPSAADYTVWRDTLGSNVDLRADANRNGVVDEMDYQLWKLAFRSALPPGIPGDFNADGIVSAADYTVWRDTLGSTSNLRADANHNGIVDEADYGIWKQNFSRGQDASPPGLAAPEPPGCVLLLAALIRMMAMRRRIG